METSIQEQAEAGIKVVNNSPLYEREQVIDMRAMRAEEFSGYKGLKLRVKMIHELRVFHCVPGRLPALLKRFEVDTLRLFEKHGVKQLGFWTVAIGESNNDLFLILQWESLAERELKFGAFLKDPEWLDVRRKSEEHGPVEASITNTILVPTTFSMLR